MSFVTGLLEGVASGLERNQEMELKQQQQQQREAMIKAQTKLFEQQLRAGELEAAESTRKQGYRTALGDALKQYGGSPADFWNDPASAAVQQQYPMMSMESQAKAAGLSEKIAMAQIMQRMGGGGGGFYMSGISGGKPQFGSTQEVHDWRNTVDENNKPIQVGYNRLGQEVVRKPVPPDFTQVKQTVPGGTATMLVDRNLPGTGRQIGMEETKLSAQESGSVANIEIGLEAAARMRQQIADLAQNPMKLRFMLGGAELGLPVPGARLFRSDSKTASDAVTRARTGAAMTTDEWESMQDEMIPSALDDEKTIVIKLQKLDRFLSGQWKGLNLPPSLRKREIEFQNKKKQGGQKRYESEEDVDKRLMELGVDPSKL